MTKRRTSPLQRVSELLSRPATGQLWLRHQKYRELRNYVRARLPSFLSEHCCACIVRDDQLIVFTTSAAGATPLRFALPQLLPEVRSRFALPVRLAQVRILKNYPAANVARPIRPPGRTVIDHLQRAAACSSAPELRSALQRLAATCSRLAQGPADPCC